MDAAGIQEGCCDASIQLLVKTSLSLMGIFHELAPRIQPVAA